MLAAQFARHLRVDSDDIEHLMALPADAVYDDPLYKALLAAIDPQELEQSAHLVRAVYEENLDELKAEFALSDTVMSGYTLVNWTLGFMMYPDRMRDMLPVHASVPSELVAKVLPRLLELLDQVEDHGEVWKQTLLTFTLPLVAAR